MNPWILGPDALQEPWRLWTCHLVHRDLEHALGNALALLIPFLLLNRAERRRLGVWLLALAPLLSLSLMPFLQGSSFMGVSGLACIAWAFTGIQLGARAESCPLGIAMLSLLALKFGVESFTGSGILVHEGRWQSLSESHLHGTLLGLMAGALDEGVCRWAVRKRRHFLRALRTCFDFPR